MRLAVIVGILGLLAACSSPEEMSEDVGVTPAAASVSRETADEKLARLVPDAKPVNFEDNAEQGKAKREFSYAWPKQVSAIPALTERLTQDRDDALAAQKAEWSEAIAEFGTEDCMSCVNRGYGMEWKVVADTPRFLSLSAEGYTYTGGAHGNSGFDTLVWDREAREGQGDVIAPKAMFTSAAALWSAIEEPYCTALSGQRAERRGEAFEPSQDDLFGACPSIDELVLLVGSSNGDTFDRLGLLAAPYVAGSYAEGPYEVTVPVTDAVLNALKPRYKDAFATQ